MRSLKNYLSIIIISFAVFGCGIQKEDGGLLEQNNLAPTHPGQQHLPDAWYSILSPSTRSPINVVIPTQTISLPTNIDCTIGNTNCFSQEEYSEISRVIDTWNHASLDPDISFINYTQSLSNQMFPSIDNSPASLSQYISNPETGIYKVTSGWNLGENVLAIAITYVSNPVPANNPIVKIILRGDIILNEHYYDFRLIDSSINETEFDLRLVMAHEIGHLLGLKHTLGQELSNSIMIPSVGPLSNMPQILGDYKIPPFDINSINTNYGISPQNSPFAINGLASDSNSNDDDNRGPAGLEEQENQVSPEMDQFLNDVPQNINEIGGAIILQELHSDGTCLHKINGKVISGHKVNLNSL